MRTESGEYIPDDIMASIELSPESQAVIREIDELYDRGELFVGDSAAVQCNQTVEELVTRSIASLVSDLKRHLGAEDIATSYYDGSIQRINRWNEIVRWWHDGWGYYGWHDYRTQTCHYIGRRRMGRWERP